MRLRPGRPDLERHRDGFDVPRARGGVGVTFLGVSSLLFDDGESAVLFDGFFSRPSLLTVALGRVAPDDARVDAALARLGLGLGRGARGLAAVVPVHTHYDHALDSGVVAARTGAVLVGGESAANVGRGAGLPEDRLRTVGDGDAVSFGSYTLTFVVSDHCPPDRFPGVIDEPVVPPVRAKAYRCGEAWSVLVEHVSGRTALVQGSAGFVPGALRGRRADVVYLGVGQLGVQTEDYIRSYWTHTARVVGARRAVLTHWDDFFRPLDLPLRALPYAGDDLDVTMRVLGGCAATDGTSLHFPAVWEREDPWEGLAGRDGPDPR
jgi:L-ascorbate metabolism protein UlaG (beta-lactamase superfamily)